MTPNGHCYGDLQRKPRLDQPCRRGGPCAAPRAPAAATSDAHKGRGARGVRALGLSAEDQGRRLGGEGGSAGRRPGPHGLPGVERPWQGPRHQEPAKRVIFHGTKRSEREVDEGEGCIGQGRVEERRREGGPEVGRGRRDPLGCQTQGGLVEVHGQGQRERAVLQVPKNRGLRQPQDPPSADSPPFPRGRPGGGGQHRVYLRRAGGHRRRQHRDCLLLERRYDDGNGEFPGRAVEPLLARGRRADAVGVEGQGVSPCGWAELVV